MKGIDYFNTLIQEEKIFIEKYLIEKYNKNLNDILNQMTPEEVQKILDDWIEKEGIDPTEGTED